MRVKTIVCDLNGTLLSHVKEISSATNRRQAVSVFREEKILLIFALMKMASICLGETRDFSRREIGAIFFPIRR